MNIKARIQVLGSFIVFYAIPFFFSLVVFTISSSSQELLFYWDFLSLSLLVLKWFFLIFAMGSVLICCFLLTLINPVIFTPEKKFMTLF